jgi:septum site-determining protein MinC
LKATKRAQSAAFRLRGTTVPIIAMQVIDADLQRLEAEVLQKVKEAAGSLSGALALIDLSNVEVDPAPLAALCHMARRFGMHPVAVAGIDEASEEAKDLGLAVLPSSPLNARTGKAEPEARPAGEPPMEPAPAPAAQSTPRQTASDAAQPVSPPSAVPVSPPPPVSALVVDKPVRSGQRIYARGCDLVLLDAASAGSELIADGNIHCYGALRGRALAGAGGDHDAQIFTLDFQAELVSIAGIYKAFERLPDDIRGKPVRASLLFADEQPQIVLGPLTGSRHYFSSDSNKQRPSA